MTAETTAGNPGRHLAGSRQVEQCQECGHRWGEEAVGVRNMCQQVEGPQTQIAGLHSLEKPIGDHKEGCASLLGMR